MTINSLKILLFVFLHKIKVYIDKANRLRR